MSESLMNILGELDASFEEAVKDPAFMKEYDYYLKEYVGRETPLFILARLILSPTCAIRSSPP